MASVLLFLVLAGLLDSSTPGDIAGFDALIRYARFQHQRAVVIECAGLFWILMELLILFLAVAARRHLESEPLPRRVTLNRVERRRAIVWGAVFLIVAAAILSRHAVLTPLYVSVQRATATGAGFQAEALKQAYLARAHTHLAIWAVFVTIWGALEGMIVYHGSRGYLRLRHLVQAAERKRSP